MVEETTMTPEVDETMSAEPTTEQTMEVNPEEEAIAQVIQIIASLSAESQRQLMGFLTEQFSTVMNEEQAQAAASPEEQARKADVMSEAF